MLPEKKAFGCNAIKEKIFSELKKVINNNIKNQTITLSMIIQVVTLYLLDLLKILSEKDGLKFLLV